MRAASGHVQSLPVHALKTVPEHRPVLFLENIRANLDHGVRPDADDVLVECGVVDSLCTDSEAAGPI